MLIEQTLFGEVDKVQVAIDRLKEHEPDEGYYLAFSGGKDSVCIKALADMAHVKYDAHYNITTVDPPELVKFIKRFHPDVIRERPEINMWKLIIRHGTPPLGQMRYCCEKLKEYSGAGRVVITGIRAEESVKRSKNRKIWNLPRCGQRGGGKYVLNPIFDWKQIDVWEFIRINHLPYCNLYDKGRHRLGCILCPLSSKYNKLRDIKEYPHIVDMYKIAMDKALISNSQKGIISKRKFKSGSEMFDWWVNSPPKYDFETYGLFD